MYLQKGSQSQARKYLFSKNSTHGAIYGTKFPFRLPTWPTERVSASEMEGAGECDSFLWVFVEENCRGKWFGSFSSGKCLKLELKLDFNWIEMSADKSVPQMHNWFMQTKSENRKTGREAKVSWSRKVTMQMQISPESPFYYLFMYIRCVFSILFC